MKTPSVVVLPFIYGVECNLITNQKKKKITVISCKYTVPDRGVDDHGVNDLAHDAATSGGNMPVTSSPF